MTLSPITTQSPWGGVIFILLCVGHRHESFMNFRDSLKELQLLLKFPYNQEGIDAWDGA